jgi:hypothetical protein
MYHPNSVFWNSGVETKRNFLDLRACEVRRITLPRTPLNKDGMGHERLALGPDDLPIRLHLTALFGLLGCVVQSREGADRVGVFGAPVPFPSRLGERLTPDRSGIEK